MTGCAIGIDVGGTKIAIGVVRFPEGKILACDIRPTLPERGGPAILEEICNTAGTLAREGPVQAVGLAVCELVDRTGNIVSNNCLQWNAADVRKRLSRIAPTTIEADVRAAALGEAQFGAGKPFKNFLYITIGTGISSCLVLDGKPYLGAHGLTGTFASSPLPGLNQSLENLASGAALARRGPPDPTQVRTAAEALGAGIGLLINTLDPEAVIIGGGLGLSGGLYWDTLVASTRRHIWSPHHRELPIHPAANAQSALIGAAAFSLSALSA